MYLSKYLKKSFFEKITLFYPLKGIKHIPKTAKLRFTDIERLPYRDFTAVSPQMNSFFSQYISKFSEFFYVFENIVFEQIQGYNREHVS